MGFMKSTRLLPMAFRLSDRAFWGSQSNVRSIVTSISVEERLQGKVKWFDPIKGYGFINPADGSRECFIHHSGIISDHFRTLDDGEEVEFEMAEENKGRPVATNVTGIGGQPVKGTTRVALNRQGERIEGAGSEFWG